MEALITI